ncbi:HsdM family class I SAM-dependent methyltransferase [Streptosporangium sp. NBC_01469]|uniref:HsdM family class I SAM-dependent methyltransferase n=1 Tax=Streptosporangium sp. NBC_01469 TaxID=2903898 RepID=UPI002E2C2113|nr:N-6 DNA methylase [Streptosporangium sp. NBC_01469]
MEESQEITVNAGDIARLAGVGRAAVSNWRRRHEDFPQPVGGTTSSPLFSLPEIAVWLRANGKSFEVSLGDLVWQRMRTSVDDLRLGGLVAKVGAFLLFLRREPTAWRDHGTKSLTRVAEVTTDLPGSADLRLDDLALVRLVAELAAERGPLEVFEFLFERYVEAHSRQLPVTRDDVAALMVRLAAEDGGVVLDPACGVGTLLLGADSWAGQRGGAATGPEAGPQAGRRTVLMGQEINETNALLTAVRVLLRGAEARIVAGDSLREDHLAGEPADAVVCDPPFNERVWGHEELAGDPRWEYGLPPRGESELAWVQHCLARVRPGGLVAILMPTAAASRRPGKRIRGNLLRAGALRAVVTLAPGGPDLWMLRRPDGGRPPSQLLVVDAGEDLSIVEPAWRAYAENPEAELSGESRTVRIIDLLDDEVDLAPSRHRPQHGGLDFLRDFTDALARFKETSALLSDATPALQLLAERQDLPTTTVGELAKAGLITILQAPSRMSADEGPLPVLTADDTAAGTPPSGRTTLDPALVMIRPGDVVTTVLGAVRVITQSGAALGPQLTLYRVDPQRLDSGFLAGFLRSADAARIHPSSSRLDVRRARVPMLPLSDQRLYGTAFRELFELEDRLRETRTLGETLIRLGFDGLVDGHLRPCDQGA